MCICGHWGSDVTQVGHDTVVRFANVPDVLLWRRLCDSSVFFHPNSEMMALVIMMDFSLEGG